MPQLQSGDRSRAKWVSLVEYDILFLIVEINICEVFEACDEASVEAELPVSKE